MLNADGSAVWTLTVVELYRKNKGATASKKLLGVNLRLILNY
jgi:hypothetical protein